MASFDLEICGIARSHQLRETWATHTVSLIDRKYSGAFPAGDSAVHHVHRFDDVEADMGELKAPVRADLEKILAFTANLQDGDRLLVHCHAGVSRSTSAAIAILIQHGVPFTEAFDRVKAIRPPLWPNHTIVKLTDEVFGLGGHLVEHVTAWKRECLNGNLFIPAETPSKDAVDDITRFMAAMTGREFEIVEDPFGQAVDENFEYSRSPAVTLVLTDEDQGLYLDGALLAVAPSFDDDTIAGLVAATDTPEITRIDRRGTGSTHLPAALATLDVLDQEG